MDESNLKMQSDPTAGGDSAPTSPAVPHGVLLRWRNTLITINLVVLGCSFLCLVPFSLAIIEVLGPIRSIGFHAYWTMLFVAWIFEFVTMILDFVAMDLALFAALTGESRGSWKFGCLWLSISFVGFFAVSCALVLICMSVHGPGLF